MEVIFVDCKGLTLTKTEQAAWKQTWQRRQLLWGSWLRKWMKSPPVLLVNSLLREIAHCLSRSFISLLLFMRTPWQLPQQYWEILYNSMYMACGTWIIFCQTSWPVARGMRMYGHIISRSCPEALHRSLGSSHLEKLSEAISLKRRIHFPKHCISQNMLGV